MNLIGYIDETARGGGNLLPINTNPLYLISSQKVDDSKIWEGPRTKVKAIAHIQRAIQNLPFAFLRHAQ